MSDIAGPNQANEIACGVRRLGFGVSGPHSSPIVSRQATERLIVRAYQLGVRIFDTAPSYGAGEAEGRLGAAITRLPREDCVISTKLGVYSASAGRKHRDFSADNVHRSVDASLKRLRLERLDWLLLHGPSSPEISDALLQALESERRSGRIGRLGVAGRGAEMVTALETGLFSVFMTPVHAGLDTDQMSTLLKIRDSGAELIGIEIISPSLPRHELPTSAGGVWRMARRAAGRVDIAGKLSQTPGEAIGWALTAGRAHRVVTTTTRLSHLEENARNAAFLGSEN